jgi:hypothetical protein
MKKNILYREKDIEAINENIFNIMDEASKKQLETLEPTIKEFHTIMNDVMSFLKEKKELYMVDMLLIY